MHSFGMEHSSAAKHNLGVEHSLLAGLRIIHGTQLGELQKWVPDSFACIQAAKHSCFRW
jgi:hypothetical protein